MRRSSSLLLSAFSQVNSEAKVDNLHISLCAEHDIVRLEVPVNHKLGVGMFQSL